jgi:hypothetical protein
MNDNNGNISAAIILLALAVFVHAIATALVGGDIATIMSHRLRVETKALPENVSWIDP